MAVAWKEIEGFLAKCSPEERDRVIQLPLSEWYDGRPGGPGAFCLVSAARGERYGLSDAMATEDGAASSYDDFVEGIGLSETVRRCKEIAAQLNQSTASDVRELTREVSNASASAVRVGGGAR